MQYAIYMTLEGRTDYVLLTDGAWAAQRSCGKAPANEPRLFPELRRARNYISATGRQDMAEAREYTGTKP